jgi:ubiquinone/menaquinone biosynthesis C-methylase UbiE
MSTAERRSRRPRRGFDLLAPHYRWMEGLLAGSRLHTCRTRYLPAITNAKRILLLGEGPGRFLCEVVKTCVGAEIVCLDSSRKMLGEARKVLGANVENRSVTFLETDALRHEFPHEYYDAVATHFFLDCFRADQLAKLVPRIAGALVPGGAWLLADFRLPAHGPRRWRAAINLKVMYHFFRAVTALPASYLTDPDPYLAQNGLALTKREFIDRGFIHTDLWRKIAANA